MTRQHDVVHAVPSVVERLPTVPSVVERLPTVPSVVERLPDVGLCCVPGLGLTIRSVP